MIQYDIIGDDAFNNDPSAITINMLRQAHKGGIVVLHIPQANAHVPLTHSPPSSPACEPADTN